MKKQPKARYLFYQSVDNNNKVYLDPTLIKDVIKCVLLHTIGRSIIILHFLKTILVLFPKLKYDSPLMKW